MKDWKKVSPELEMMTWDALVKMRATKPNLLLMPKYWEMKMTRLS